MRKGVRENRKARFDYEILEKFEAGIVLSGHEAKSIKTGHVNLAGAHAIVRNWEIFLVGMDVPSFQPKNAPANYDSVRTRKLLLGKKEIAYLLGKTKSGLTLVPLRLYNKGARVKIELGLARGKKQYDKRETIKKRETEREIKRAEKRSY